MTISRNTIVRAAFVSTEGSNELLRAKVIAVVAGGKEQTVAPLDRGHVLIPVFDHLKSLYYSRSTGKSFDLVEELGRVDTNFVLKAENVICNISVEAGNHGNLRWAWHCLRCRLLRELSKSILVKFEVLTRVDNRGHHIAS